jgi:hypothetical protein
LTKVLWQGLRKEILHSISNQSYSNFDTLVSEARLAEQRFGSIKDKSLFNVEEDQASGISKEAEIMQKQEDELNLLRQKIKMHETFKSPNTSTSSSTIECYQCGKRGHMRRECPRNMQKGFGQAQSSYSGHPRMTSDFRNNDFTSPRPSYDNYQPRYQPRPDRYLEWKRMQNQQRPRFSPALQPLRWSGRKNNRDPRTRQWMVKNRARFNVRNRQRRKLYNLEDASFEELDEEDQCMLILEDDFTEEERFVYFQEVEHEMAALIHVLENDEETKN